MDKYGYIGIETLLNFCENLKGHAVVPNDFMRMNRFKFEWIPCTERLPHSQEDVIVSVRDTSGDSAFAYTSVGWLTTNGEYWIVGNEICNYVIAWMPMPKPYEGGNDG